MLGAWRRISGRASTPVNPRTRCSRTSRSGVVVAASRMADLRCCLADYFETLVGFKEHPQQLADLLRVIRDTDPHPPGWAWLRLLSHHTVPTRRRITDVATRPSATAGHRLLRRVSPEPWSGNGTGKRRQVDDGVPPMCPSHVGTLSVVSATDRDILQPRKLSPN